MNSLYSKYVVSSFLKVLVKCNWISTEKKNNDKDRNLSVHIEDTNGHFDHGNFNAEIVVLCSIHTDKIYTCKYFVKRNKYTHIGKSIFTLCSHAKSVRINISLSTHTCYWPVVF